MKMLVYMAGVNGIPQPYFEQLLRYARGKELRFLSSKVNVDRGQERWSFDKIVEARQRDKNGIRNLETDTPKRLRSFELGEGSFFG